MEDEIEDETENEEHSVFVSHNQREPRLWLSGVDESSAGTTRLPVMLTFCARNDTSRNEVGFLLHPLHILQCSACFDADNTTVISQATFAVSSHLDR
jgi:hypothetical protein